MSQNSIYDAFAARVSAFAASLTPALPVAFPGVPFTPPATGRWLEVRWFPNETTTYAIQDDPPCIVFAGMGQISVCERVGAGLAGLSVANAAVEYFPKGTLLGVGRVEVQPWVSNVIQEPDRIAYPVTVRWRGVAP